MFDSPVPAALVFPVSHAAGVSVIRNLGRHGIPVLGVDFKPRSAGLFSRYAAPLFAPGIHEDEDRFVEFLVETGKKFRTAPVLFLVDDGDVFASLRRYKELEPYYRYPLCGWDILEPIVDKGRLYRLCQQHGFPIPETWWARSVEELDRKRDAIHYPCIVKPTYSERFRTAFGVKAQRFSDYSSLRDFFTQVVGRGIEAVVQEWIPGAADRLYTYAAYCNPQHEPVSVFLGRKLHQFPPDFGTARLAESVDDPELERLGRQLVALTRFHGICLIEFKKDPDGQLRLMELNPRPGGWVEYLATYCGANLVLAAYRQAIGQPVAPHRATRTGVKWANLPEDLYYCLRGYRVFGYPQSATGFLAWARSLRGLRADAFFAWTDPGPALIRNLALVRQLVEAERARSVDHLPQDN